MTVLIQSRLSYMCLVRSTAVRVEATITALTSFLLIDWEGFIPVDRLGGVPRRQKMLQGHLPRVMYHQVYEYTKTNGILTPTKLREGSN